MIRHLFAIALFAVGAILGHAQPSLPANFQAQTIHSPEGADIFVRWGGHGPVVVLIHGYAENSDSWAPLATDYVGWRGVHVDGRDSRFLRRSLRECRTARHY